MTKKDYELIAKKIYYLTTVSMIAGRGEVVKKEQILTVLDCLAEHLAEGLEKDNPKFDEDKFIKACGLSEAV